MRNITNHSRSTGIGIYLNTTRTGVWLNATKSPFWSRELSVMQELRDCVNSCQQLSKSVQMRYGYLALPRLLTQR
jgi:hypothetical protein